jgi:intracellular multiplication protein IcmP
MSNDGKNTAHEGAIGWIILFAIVAFLIWLIWPMFDDSVKNIIRWIRYGEIKLAALFLNEDTYVMMNNGNPITMQQMMDSIEVIPAQDITGHALQLMSMMALYPFRYVYIAILSGMALWAYMNGPGTQFRRVLNLDGLIGAQAKNFRVISPFVKFNPSTMPTRPPGTPVPAELPLFSEALGPEEWIAYNQIPVPDGKMDEHAAYLAFARQLGPRWQGYKTLAPYKQILLASFCLKASRKRVDADEMLGRLASCWSQDGGLQLSKDRSLHRDALRVLNNKSLSETVLSKANLHAYQTTALLRALQTARDEGGVMAPAQFVWLRGHDRNLWYPLNNLGRQGFHMEAIGAMAHYKAEKMTNRPIPRPKIRDAILSIAEYMSSRRARPIPQLDYSNSKKRGIKKPQAGIKKPQA